MTSTQSSIFSAAGDESQTVCDWPLNVTRLREQFDDPLVSLQSEEQQEGFRCHCIRQAAYQHFQFIVDVLVVCPMIVVGLIGNSLSVVVLRRDSSINYATCLLLGAIAVVDNVYLVSCFVYQTLKAICNYKPLPSYNAEGKFVFTETEGFCSQQFLDVYPSIERVAWDVANLSMTTVTWLIVVVTLGRYCAICRPLVSLRLSTRPLVRKTLAGVILLALAYNTPSYFEHEVVPYVDECRARVALKLGYSELRSRPNYFIIYKTFIYFLFRFLLPLSTLTVLNVRLLMTLRQQRNYDSKTSIGDDFVAANSSNASTATSSGGSANSAIAAAAAVAYRRRRRRKCLPLRRFCRTDDPSVTALVVGMVSLFIVCQLPDLMLRVSETVDQLRSMSKSPAGVPRTTNNKTANATGVFQLPEVDNGEKTTTHHFYDYAEAETIALGQKLTTRFSYESSTGREQRQQELLQATSSTSTGDNATANVDVGPSEETFLNGYINTITNALLTLNSSTNYLVYCFSGRRFRQHLRQLVCGHSTSGRRRRRSSLPLQRRSVDAGGRSSLFDGLFWRRRHSIIGTRQVARKCSFEQIQASLIRRKPVVGFLPQRVDLMSEDGKVSADSNRGGEGGESEALVTKTAAKKERFIDRRSAYCGSLDDSYCGSSIKTTSETVVPATPITTYLSTGLPD